MTEQLKCRPGDRAIIVKAHRCAHPGNLGMVVEIQEPVDLVDSPMEGEGYGWWVNSLGSELRFFWKGEVLYEQMDGPVPDHCLIPLPVLPAISEGLTDTSFDPK